MLMLEKIFFTIKILISISICSFAAVWITDNWLLPYYTRYADELHVPDLTGSDLTQATKKLHDLELTPMIRRQFNRQTPKNTVLYQSPEPGSIVKKGRVIRLTVSDDEQFVIVPQLKLATIRDARFILETSSLKPGKQIAETSQEFPAGIIIGQSVEPGTKLQAGSTVDLIVSSGRTMSNIRVPYLVGKSLIEAKVITADSTIKLGTILKKFNPDLLPGTVTAQLPDSGTSVAPYSEIQITVSSNDPADE